MMAVIKRHNPHLAAIGRAGVAVAAAPAPVPDPLRIECERLTARVAELERRLVAAEADAMRAINVARAEGHAAGLAAADRRDDDRLEALAAGIATGCTAFSERLDALDGLAAALARAALAKMFDASPAMADMVVSTIARNIDLLRAQATQRIIISAQDFAEPDIVAALCETGVTVEISRTLGAGACRVECRLGTIDLDVPQQWAQVAAALDAMAGTA